MDLLEAHQFLLVTPTPLCVSVAAADKTAVPHDQRVCPEGSRCGTWALTVHGPGVRSRGWEAVAFRAATPNHFCTRSVIVQRGSDLSAVLTETLRRAEFSELGVQDPENLGE